MSDVRIPCPECGWLMAYIPSEQLDICENQGCTRDAVRDGDFIFAPVENYNKSASKLRKERPLFSGVMMYFPDALLAVAEHSKKGNDKHNPGEPLRWAREKSTDQADCIARHLIDIGPNWDALDPETGSYHAAALAWRALALLQLVLERTKGVK